VPQEKGDAVIVEVVGGREEHPEVRVVDVDNLTALHLALGEVTDEEAGEILEQAGLGRIEDADTAVLDAAALRATAEPQATSADWAARWDALVGRLSDDGATMRVRVESAAGA
jgi:hypothetical protein